MADVAAMDIVIGADVQKAIAGLEHLSDELMQMSKTGVTSIEQLNRAMATIRESAAKATDIGQLAKFNTVLEKLSGEAIRLKNIKLGDALKNIKPGADQAANALTNMGRIVRDAPFGFIAIQNNLNPMLESFQRLQKESGSTGSALKSLGKELIGPAGLGIALSVVSAIIIKYPDLLSLVSKEAALAAKNQKDYTDAMASSIAPAQTQITTLNNLLSIARDSSQSLQTQKNAIAEINRLYPERLKFLNQENINSSAAKEAIDKVTQSLILQAQAQAASNLLTKANEALMKAQNGELSDNVDNWDAFFLGLKNVGNLTNTVADLQKKAAANQKTAINDATKQQEKYSEILKGIQAQLAKIGGFTPPPPPRPPKKEPIDEITKALKQLNEARLNLSTQIGIDPISRMLKDAELLKEGISKLIELKAPEALIIKLQAQLDEEAPAAIAADIKRKFVTPTIPYPPIPVPIVPVMDNQEVKDAITKGQAEIFAITHGIELPVNFKFMSAAEADKWFEDIKKHVPKTAKEIAEAFNKGLTDTIEKGLEDMAGAFAEGLGNLISGKSGNPFAGVYDVIAGVMESLGKTLIGLGIGLEAIRTALKTLNPFVAIGAGVALIALAQVVKNSVSHMAMAEGGIVTGPTRALIGEAGPEVVFPLDRLREFIRPAQAQVVVLETRVRGSDIWLSQSRTNERRGRTY